MTERFAAKAVKQSTLQFPLLLDPGNRVARDFGLAFNLPDDLRATYQSFGIDLERVNGDASWTLAMPARYVIDSDGHIRNASVSIDYTDRPEPEETLQILRQVR
jgi:peroxiredoxin